MNELLTTDWLIHWFSHVTAIIVVCSFTLRNLVKQHPPAQDFFLHNHGTLKPCLKYESYSISKLILDFIDMYNFNFLISVLFFQKKKLLTATSHEPSTKSRIHRLHNSRRRKFRYETLPKLNECYRLINESANSGFNFFFMTFDAVPQARDS